MFPHGFTEDVTTYMTRVVLASFMGSLSASLWPENVLKCVKCVENPLPSDTQYFTLTAMDNFDNADKNSLSSMKHAHDTALIVFQVKLKSCKSKRTITSIDISSIKSSDKIKCQEIKISALTRSYRWRSHF